MVFWAIPIDSPDGWNARKSLLGSRILFLMGSGTADEAQCLSLKRQPQEATGVSVLNQKSGQLCEHNPRLPNAHDLHPADQITLQIPGGRGFSSSTLLGGQGAGGMVNNSLQPQEHLRYLY